VSPQPRKPPGGGGDAARGGGESLAARRGNRKAVRGGDEGWRGVTRASGDGGGRQEGRRRRRTDCGEDISEEEWGGRPATVALEFSSSEAEAAWRRRWCGSAAVGPNGLCVIWALSLFFFCTYGLS